MPVRARVEYYRSLDMAQTEAMICHLIVDGNFSFATANKLMTDAVNLMCPIQKVIDFSSFLLSSVLTATTKPIKPNRHSNNPRLRL